MALLGWLFSAHRVRPRLPAGMIDALILLLLHGSDVRLVWSKLVDGEPYFTQSQQE